MTSSLFYYFSPTVNIGNYVILPTPAATTFLETWSASASAAIQAKQQDQFFLPSLQHLFELCHTPGSCLAKRGEVRLMLCTWAQACCRWKLQLPLLVGAVPPAGASTPAGGLTAGLPIPMAHALLRARWLAVCMADKPVMHAVCCLPALQLAEGQKALFRTYLPSFWPYSPDFCSLAHPDTMPLVDTCDWSGTQAVEEHMLDSSCACMGMPPRTAALELPKLCLSNLCLHVPLPFSPLFQYSSSTPYAWGTTGARQLS